MRVFRLTPTSRQHAIEHIKNAPDGYVVKVSEPRKSRDQEEKYHAMIGDIAEQFTHCGRKWKEGDMKRLLVDQFRRETRDILADEWAKFGNVEMVPSLDGSGVVMLGIQTREFTKRLAVSFVDWLYAFGADCDPPIVWSDPMEDRAAA